VHPLTGLMSVLGHGPGLLAKREGLCGIAAGGNKIRRWRPCSATHRPSAKRWFSPPAPRSRTTARWPSSPPAARSGQPG